MTTLREAAQQALEALEYYRSGEDYQPTPASEAITALRAALSEPVQEPVAWWHRKSDTFTSGNLISKFNEWTPLYPAPPRCPNCASLEAQNTELDRKLADLEQTSLELCETCGWRTLIPGEGCLNCARSKQAVQEPVTWRWGYRSVTTGEMDWRGYVEIPSHPDLRSPAIIMEPLYTASPQRKPLTDGEIKRIDDSTHFHESPDWSLRFARAVERAHGIGEQP